MLTDKIDKRTINGMKADIQRRVEKKEHVIAQLLKNFLSVVQAAQDLGPSQFKHTDDLTVHKHMTLMQQEQVVIPPCLRLRLAMRRAHKLLSERRYPELLQVCDPFTQQEFDFKEPCLAMVGGSEATDRKLSAFKQTLFNDLLLQLLAEGEGKSDDVLSLTELCLQRYGAVDVVELDNASASCHTAAMSIWQGLHTILRPSTDLTGLDHLM